MALGHTFIGDHGPIAVMHNGQQIAGAVKTQASGTGRVELGEGIYNSGLPGVVVHGEGQQDKLEGKNKIIYPYSQSTVTIEGVTFTDNGDMSVTVNGTATNRATFDFSAGLIPKSTIPEISFFTGCPRGGSASTYRCFIDFIGSDFGTGVLVDKKAILFETVSVKIIIEKGYTASDLVFRPQLEPGYKATSFEPFCGGIPAPNPQYPIEPVFLDGASVGAREKNLFRNSHDIWKAADPYYIYEIPLPHKQVADAIVSISKVKDNFDISGVHFGIAAPFDGLPSGNFKWLVFNGVIEYPQYNVPDGWTRLFVYPMEPVILDKIENALNIQLELSSTPTPYEPYFDGGTAHLPILRALPDGSVRDEIDAISGIKANEIIEVVFNEKLISSLLWLDGYAYKDGFPLSVDNISGIFTHGEYGPLSSDIPEGRICFFQSGIMRVSVGKGTLNETQEFMRVELKKGHPLKAWYALAEPIIEHYDPAILRQHPGYTQLLQEGGEMQAVIDAEYWKELGE